MNKSPQEIWNEYQKCIDYNASIGLYETVKNNENFFIGKQWEGVNAPDLDKPVFNVIKRVVNLFISMLVSDDIAANVEPMGVLTDDEIKMSMSVVNDEITRTIENTKAKSKNRDVLRNACIDGDGCFYLYFNPSIKTGQDIQGAIDIEVIDNVNVLFGNAQEQDVQRQPFVILQMRKTLGDVKTEAKNNKVSDWDEITADSDSNEINSDNANDKVTVLIKFWKENGTIRFLKTTQNIIITPEKDTGCRLYPIAYMSWDKVKNSYHGQAAVTGLIPNQIFINKCYAMAMDYVKKCAFPKVVYDGNRLPNGWNNKVGEAIKVIGNPNETVAEGIKLPDMSNQVMDLVEKTMQYTKELMGASDVSLGNVKPDNTSAIIALQKSSVAPLELVKMAFYQFVEDYIRIMIDIMSQYYGVRKVTVDGEKGKAILPFDFSILNNYELLLNVSVGASAYWSETMLVQTADNLYSKGIINDPVTYLDSIPDAFVKNKAKIQRDLKNRQTLQSQIIQPNING